MTFTKWVGLLALMAGCTTKPDYVEFPVVYGSWGSASASLSANEDKGFIHVDLKDGLKLIWISLSLYGGPEDITCITKADMPEELKEWILTNESDYIPKYLLLDPFYDGEHAWVDYGGMGGLAFGGGCIEDRYRRDREWLHNIPTSVLKMTFPGFDVSRGYKNIGYIVIVISCKDDNGAPRYIYAILNRADLKRFKVGEEGGDGLFDHSTELSNLQTSLSTVQPNFQTFKPSNFQTFKLLIQPFNLSTVQPHFTPTMETRM